MTCRNKTLFLQESVSVRFRLRVLRERYLAQLCSSSLNKKWVRHHQKSKGIFRAVERKYGPRVKIMRENLARGENCRSRGENHAALHYLPFSSCRFLGWVFEKTANPGRNLLPSIRAEYINIYKGVSHIPTQPRTQWRELSIWLPKLG